MSAKKDRLVTFACSSELLEQLEDVCREEERPRSAVVRRFVERALVCYSERGADPSDVEQRR